MAKMHAEVEELKKEKLQRSSTADAKALTQTADLTLQSSLAQGHLRLSEMSASQEEKLTRMTLDNERQLVLGESEETATAAVLALS